MDKEGVVYIHTQEYYSTIKKNENLPFATTWMDLEGIMLSEISQTEKDKYHMVSHICGIFFKNTKLIEKNNQICGYQKQGGGGEKE